MYERLTKEIKRIKIRRKMMWGIQYIAKGIQRALKKYYGKNSTVDTRLLVRVKDSLNLKTILGYKTLKFRCERK